LPTNALAAAAIAPVTNGVSINDWMRGVRVGIIAEVSVMIIRGWVILVMCKKADCVTVRGPAFIAPSMICPAGVAPRPITPSVITPSPTGVG
jgi:hypothetical protein